MVIERWIEEITDRRIRDRVLELRQRYEFLAARLFAEYEPTRRDSRRHQHDFMLRMEKWLDQFRSDEQKLIAFQSIEYLFFAGVEEFDELYRCAFTVVQRWLMEVKDWDPFECREAVRKELKKCWFCPITDSFRINSFLHVMGVSGKEHRPDWLSMSRFAKKKKISEYVESQEISYLVLLEDFVGSGSQACRVIEFALSALNIKILVVPLIICAPGVEKIAKVAALHSSVFLKPIVILPKNCLVTPTKNDGEPKLFTRLRGVMRNHYRRLGKRLTGGAYGFCKVGSLVVTHSNCPNNTPPIYRYARVNDTPLFPRQSRPWARR